MLNDPSVVPVGDPLVVIPVDTLHTSVIVKVTSVIVVKVTSVIVVKVTSVIVKVTTVCVSRGVRRTRGRVVVSRSSFFSCPFGLRGKRSHRKVVGGTVGRSTVPSFEDYNGRLLVPTYSSVPRYVTIVRVEDI